MNTRGARILKRELPMGGTRAYKTYQIASPLETHFRRATCQEVNCPRWRRGWSLNASALQPQDWFAIKQSGRKYSTVEGREGNVLVFEAGQPCFKTTLHKIAVGRPEIYRVGRGDWRSYDPRQARTYRAEDWVDDFRNHQDRLATRLQRG